MISRGGTASTSISSTGGGKPSEEQPSLLEQALKNQVEQERERDGRAAKTMFGIVDAQSVKNADTAREKGDDAGKGLRHQA